VPKKASLIPSQAIGRGSAKYLPPVRLLLLATSGPSASVGYAPGDGPVEAVPLGSGSERGRGVLRVVHELLAGKGLGPKDLEGIAVDVGPGSFTGVRVGVATAKALALGLSIPVVGITSLDALAVAAGPTTDPLLCLRDARAEEAYFALYEPTPADGADRPPRRMGRLRRGTADSIREALEERGLRKALAIGEDAERLAVTMRLHPHLAGVRTPVVGPVEVALLALPRFRAGTADDPDALAPCYLQPSTPERRLAGDRPFK
jgi:tRNA threonylcarbamoyladenosine biosynthesis protein TsaB